MDKKAQKYYVKLFKKLYKTTEWQDYMKKKSLRGAFITGQTLQDYFAKEKENHRAMLKNIGEIK